MRFLLAIFLLLPAFAFAETLTHVEHVIDGDTFVTTEGETVRLLGINTPEVGGHRAAEPYGEEAKKAAETLLTGQPVRLVNDTTEKDRYQRRLSHAYLADGRWVNAELVRSGVAHVYSFPDNRSKLDELLAAEQQARAQKTGLWALPRWQPLAADIVFTREQVGQFHLVTGRVKNVARARGHIYLNFGDDWRTDFTIEIRPDDVATFKAAHIDPMRAYASKTVRVRGHLKPVNGVLITATHPEQIEIIDEPTPLLKELQAP